MSVTELRKLLGDSLLHLVLTNGEAVIDVVNLNRRPSVAQVLAKLFVDSGCGVEGCDRAARLEFDHRDDWARTQTTELANLDLLCDHHHDQKTYDGWQLVDGTGRRPMVPPDDPRQPDRTTHPDRTSHAAAPTATETQPGTDDRSIQDRGAGERSTEERVADLAARLARIRRKDAERQARLAGQGDLFDTG